MPRKVIRAFLACAVSFLITAAIDSRAGEQLIPLYVFEGQADGGQPNAGLVADAQGNLYGTTYFGGSHACAAGCGTIFEVAPQADGSWKESTVYTFQGGTDGGSPSAPLVRDKSGALYGTAPPRGENGGGTIYRLTPNRAAWTFDILYNFPAGEGDLNPYSQVVVQGNKLYAIAWTGGAPDCKYYGCGSFFELKAPKDGGVPWKRIVLFQFPGGEGGGVPSWLVKDPLSSTMYIATTYGNGAVVALSPSGKGQWTETVLYSFAGGSDGYYPFDLVVGADGTIYGTAWFSSGGNEVFSLTPPIGGSGAWTKTQLYSGYPYGPTSLTLAPNGAFVGVEFGEIDFDAGHAFKLSPPKDPGKAWRYRQLYDFNTCCLSRNPENLIYGKGHQLYGALEGGDSDFGAVFELQH